MRDRVAVYRELCVQGALCPPTPSDAREADAQMLEARTGFVPAWFRNPFACLRLHQQVAAAFFWSTSFGGDVCLPRVKRRMGGRPVASSIINLCSFGCARLLPNFSSSVLQAIPGREGGHTVYSPWELEESRIDKLPLEANGKCCPGFAALQVPPARICPHAALSVPIRHSSLAGAGADRCVGRCLFIYVSIVAFPHRLRTWGCCPHRPGRILSRPSRQ